MADGIILGAVAGEVLHQILDMTYKVMSFREDVQKLQDTLQHLVPLVKEGKDLDLELTDQKRKGIVKFEKKLSQGKELIEKCLKISSPNFIQKIRYSNKISDLDDAIRRFCGLELQVENWRDNKLLLKKMEELTAQVRLTQIGGMGVAVGVPVGVGTLRNEGLFKVPDLPGSVVGFDIPLKELKNELFKENVTVLGLCAPGGCGKSTLAAMLCQDEEVRGRFKGKIFFVTVTKTPTSRIPQRLLEEIGDRVPVSDLSDEDAAKQLCHLLTQRNSEPLLLVLDDVWDESIIEKFFYGTEGYKLLVTSREAFKIYNSRYHSKYILKTLSLQDSTTLFRKTALSQDRNEDYEPDEDILNEIVRCCDGFPLAITVIAKSLYQQHPVIWENMAKKLLKGSCILDFDSKLQERLAASLDSLDPIALQCFMDLSSFPEDKRIPASALVDIWCELYELDYESEAFAILIDLASRNLINLVGSRKTATQIVASFNELFVTQHDLLRDLAIYQSRQRLILYKKEKSLPESWKKQNHYFNPLLVSLGTGEMFVGSWYDLQLPEVEVLILNFSTSNYALPPFMEKMRKLKALIVVNRGRTRAKLSNLIRLSELVNVKRIRLEKVLIPSLHEFTMPLMNLQKISLFMCDLDQALMKCTINGSYVLPNLVEINIDYCHGLVELPPWICDLVNLQTLSITNCDNLSALTERIGLITDLDLLRLHACTGLHTLPDSIKRLQKLRFLDISDCCNLKMLPDGMGELHCLKKLDMRGCIELSELPPSAMNLFQLKEVICDDVDGASLWEPLSSSLKITVLERDNNLEWLGVDI
ncbi:putative disease resistance protein At5g47280 isoform X2 [Macadamia integrifolia]|uniref:putative disease resistance protein At5g47280 isoform X1 n=1 Tax=Macadamia integrifolia TaxID=60698 RepID=UPI001C4FCCB7|nr:putative disease resistance protein At5g47280 isoform X1 [Macadamia integrifolia]XP_042494857.1 putative disease resistance protein At5g47280 isoform X2 [Macadamia integrifolia]